MSEDYLERSPFCQLHGKNARSRIIIFFLAHQDFEYNQTEIAKHTGLTRQTVAKEIEPLIRFGVIEKINGKHRANIRNPVFMRIRELNTELVKVEVQRQKEETEPTA